jgi:hypothetical protein
MPSPPLRRCRRLCGRARRLALPALSLALVALAAPAAAHAGSLRVGTAVAVPDWLFLLTGGGVVAFSFLFTSFLTDRATVRALHERRYPLGRVPRRVVRALQVASVLALAAVVLAGALGPSTPTANLAVLIVWVGWWAGYTVSIYLVGDSWSALNPWRALARILPGADRPLPERLGRWPATAGLLGLVYLEVVTPLAEDPRALAVVVLAYTAVTLAGAAAYGSETWFGQVDPVAAVFRAYGEVAPVGRRADGRLELRLPGAGLPRHRPEPGDTAFVVALLWATTFDGLVGTPPWADAVRPVVVAGVPPLLAYLVGLLVGFGAFYAAYRGASRLVRRTADSYVAADVIRAQFAPSLLPIAAGYHVAHFLPYFLSLLPALAVALTSPLAAPATVPVLGLPGWFGRVGIAAVLLGHVLAVVVAHATAFELFVGRLQPIKSQYPYVVLMFAYTMTSLWLLSQPTNAPPFV